MHCNTIYKYYYSLTVIKTELGITKSKNKSSVVELNLE